MLVPPKKEAAMKAKESAKEIYEKFLDELPKTTPGTLGGQMLRRYWHPVCLTSDLTTDVPYAVRMLGEDLVAFRDGQGRVGLIGMSCSHRRASLEYGQITKEGLMCSYHGFKYDTTGHILETPLEPNDSTLKDELRHPWYPVQEWRGVVWTYMGPERENPPPLVKIDVMARHGVDGKLTVNRGDYRDYNYLNWLENFCDQGHVAILHTLSYRDIPPQYGPYSDPTISWHKYPQLHNVETDYGLKTISHWETGDPEVDFINSWVVALPTHWRFSAGASMDFTDDRREGGGMLRIIDDSHFEIFRYNLHRPGNLRQNLGNSVVRGSDAPMVTTAEGVVLNAPRSFKFEDNVPTNDRRKYAGFIGNAGTEDLAMQETQDVGGKPYDRKVEKLARSDGGLLILRKVWREAMMAVKDGKDPKGTWRVDKGMMVVDTYRGHIKKKDLRYSAENLPDSLEGRGLIRDKDGKLVFGPQETAGTKS